MDEILNVYKILVRKMKRGIPLRLVLGNNKCESLSAVLFPCFWKRGFELRTKYLG